MTMDVSNNALREEGEKRHNFQVSRYFLGSSKRKR
jgi:hypothetical protein